MNSGPVVAVDPGSAKCGIAVLSADGQVLHRDIVAAETIGEAVDVIAETHKATHIAVGSGTACGAVMERILVFRDGSDITEVSEAHTTLQARGRYWQDNPPGCLLSLLPAGMRIPPRPIDDYAAVVIAERFLATPEDNKSIKS